MGARKPNQLRIIGGRWRGRKVTFAAVPGLRPTPDRVRETLFNWLQPVIDGAHCLDLFAGSGAMGLEALSRGAADVVMVDRDPSVVAALREQLERLGAGGARLVIADALAFLESPAEHFDIVFLDPPYGQNLLVPCCERLESGGWLAADAHIYLEQESSLALPPLPDGWQVLRSKRAGEVGYHLAVREGR